MPLFWKFDVLWFVDCGLVFHCVGGLTDSGRFGVGFKGARDERTLLMTVRLSYEVSYEVRGVRVSEPRVNDTGGTGEK